MCHVVYFLEYKSTAKCQLHCRILRRDIIGFACWPNGETTDDVTSYLIWGGGGGDRNTFPRDGVFQTKTLECAIYFNFYNVGQKKLRKMEITHFFAHVLS